MKIIAITNQKGGVGKSTTSSAFGAGLQKKGHSVLFLDLDAQSNLSFSMGAKSEILGSMGILKNPESITAEIVHTKQGDIIPSSPALAGADTWLIETGKEYRLKEALEKIQGQYEFCVVDTPPALGILTVNALTACNGVLIPAQADIYSVQGISQLYGTIQTVKKYCNPALQIFGIVLTRYNSRSIISREVADMLEGMATNIGSRLFKTKIRECTAIKEAQATKKSIFEYAPKSNAALDYTKLLTEFLEEI